MAEYSPEQVEALSDTELGRLTAIMMGWQAIGGWWEKPSPKSLYGYKMYRLEDWNPCKYHNHAAIVEQWMADQGWIWIQDFYSGNMLNCYIGGFRGYDSYAIESKAQWKEIAQRPRKMMEAAVLAKGE